MSSPNSTKIIIVPHTICIPTSFDSGDLVISSVEVEGSPTTVSLILITFDKE